MYVLVYKYDTYVHTYSLVLTLVNNNNKNTEYLYEVVHMYVLYFIDY